MRRSTSLSILLAGVVLGACSDTAVFSAPQIGRANNTTAIASVTGFAWLPPMVADPGPSTDPFDGSRTLTARIVCVGATGPRCPVVAQFDASTPAEGRLSVDLEDQSYRAMWKTPSSLELGGGRYRVEVWDGQAMLGQGDLHVVTAQKQVKSVPAGQIAVVRGNPFLIKFRITQSTAQGDQLTGIPTAPAPDAIPARLSEARLEDFNTLHPTMGGTRWLSFNTVLVRLTPTATIGDVNAMLNAEAARIVGGVPGKAPVAGGLLVLRLPTTTHEALAEAMTRLRGRSVIRGVSPDLLQDDLALPVLGNAVPTPNEWTWQVPSTSSGRGNWGFERSRVPQMWNLNDIVRRDGVNTLIGIFEGRPFATHVDLANEVRIGTGSGIANDHAIGVAGIIGATHDNGGIDGVSPFARLVLGSFFRSGNGLQMTPASLQATALEELMERNVRVLNVSQGHGYVEEADPAGFPQETALADEHGAVIFAALEAAEARGVRLPLIVAAAGNFSSEAFRVPARYGGMVQNAALVHGATNIIVVENLKESSTDGTMSLFFGSNGQAHISAPGQDVQMLDRRNSYYVDGGTSFASPLVAGVAGYLYSLYPALPAPTLTSNPVARLLLSTAAPVAAGTAPRIDAFAAAMETDLLMNGQRAMRGLLDIDDGTVDGNTRVALRTGDLVTGTQRGGDGVVTMQDFRRWRDWSLQTDPTVTSALNGGDTHPKKDVNGDGIVGSASQENVFPRGDFNGDGVISLTGKSVVPGVGNFANLTDLEVMQLLWQDPLYQSSELTGLLYSGDVEIDARACLAIPNVARVTVFARRQGEAAVVKSMPFASDAPERVLTLPSIGDNSYRLRIEARDATNALLGSNEANVSITPGSDERVALPCYRILLTAELKSPLVEKTNEPMAVKVVRIDPLTNESVPEPGAVISFTEITNGSVTPTAGVTDASGLFLPIVRATSSGTNFSVRISALTEDARVAEVVMVREVTAAPGGPPPAPTPALGYQVVGGALAGKFTSPVRYRVRFTNFPGHTVRFTTVAVVDSPTGFVGFGPIDQSVLSLTEFGPTVVDQYVVDWFAEVRFPESWQGTLRAGVIIRTTACFFQASGLPMISGTGQPLCSTRETFY